MAGLWRREVSLLFLILLSSLCCLRLCWADSPEACSSSSSWLSTASAFFRQTTGFGQEDLDAEQQTGHKHRRHHWLPFGHKKEPSEKELKHRFAEETKRRVDALPPEHKACLDALREYAYGAGVSEDRKRAADQMVVWGIRDAMLLTFLERKRFNLTIALEQFERIIQWRLQNDIDNILHRPTKYTLPKDKLQKHRQCWPTALYMHRQGDHEPIFVDRMALLELDRLKKGPTPLTLNDMLSFYVLTMEARRRLLFPKLSQECGRLICRYTSVVDVSSFSSQHWGKDAIKLMREMGRVFDDGNYSSLVGRLLIINVPWAFRRVWGLVKGIVSEELEARLLILSKKQAYQVIGEMVPADMARDIIEGDHDKERQESADLHAYLDSAAKQQLHKKSFV